MKNLALLSTLMLLNISPVRADFYIGGGGLSGSGDMEISSGGVGITTEHDTSGSFIRFGSVLSREGRVEFSANNISFDYDAGGTDDISGFDIDYLWTFGENNIHPLLGLGLGFYSLEDTAAVLVGNEDLKGVSFNFTAGLIVDLSEMVELEASIRGKSISWQDIDVFGQILETQSSFSNIGLGINFKF